VPGRYELRDGKCGLGAEFLYSHDVRFFLRGQNRFQTFEDDAGCRLVGNRKTADDINAVAHGPYDFGGNRGYDVAAGERRVEYYRFAGRQRTSRDEFRSGHRNVAETPP